MDDYVNRAEGDEAECEMLGEDAGAYPLVPRAIAIDLMFEWVRGSALLYGRLSLQTRDYRTIIGPAAGANKKIHSIQGVFWAGVPSFEGQDEGPRVAVRRKCCPTAATVLGCAVVGGGRASPLRHICVEILL